MDTEATAACLSKDTKALIKFADEAGISLDILKTTDKINKRLLLANRDIREDILNLYK